MKPIENHCEKNHKKILVKTKSLNIKNIAKLNKTFSKATGRMYLTEKNQTKSKPNSKDDVSDNDEEGKLSMRTKVKE